MPNVEFSHIIVDKGMFHDHMPDTVQEALENLHKQLFDGKPTKSHHSTQDAKSDNNEPPLQCHHSIVEPDEIEVSILGSELEDMMTEATNKASEREVNGHTTEVILESNLQPDDELSTYV